MSDSNKISEVLIDRLKNPLAGAYAISWLIWNWKPVYILCFKLVEVDLRLSEASAYFREWDSWGVPLISSVVYLLVHKYILVAIDSIQKHATLLRHSITRSINKVLRDQEKADLIELRDLQLLASKVENIDQLSSELTTLTHENKKIQESLNTFESKNRELQRLLENANRKGEQTSQQNMLISEFFDFRIEPSRKFEWLEEYLRFEAENNKHFFIQLESVKDHFELNESNREFLNKAESLALYEQYDSPASHYGITKKGQFFRLLHRMRMNMSI